MVEFTLPTRLGKEPLIDATFEVRFSSSLSDASNVLPGIFFSRLSGSHNLRVDRLPIADVPRQLRLADPALMFQPLLRIQHDQLIVAIGDNVLVIGCCMPYPGWNVFRESITKLVGFLKDSGIVERVVRYSIKYVNIVEGKDLAEQVGRVNMNLRLGTHKLVAEPFHVRLEIPCASFVQILQVVAPATISLPSGETRTGTVIDADAICSVDISDFSQFFHSLPECLNEIHEAAKKEFFDCLTADALAYLEPVYE